tara:strand:+ start:1222 stop:1947 length:726 start_codon:yes stop_codon:yes gene_type:complete
MNKDHGEREINNDPGDKRSELMSIVAHQLRVPLASIRLTHQTLLDKEMHEITDSQRRLLQQAESSAKRIDNLIGELFHLSSIESTVDNPQHAPGSLEHLADDVINLLSLQAQQKDITLKHSYATEPKLVNFDHNKLQEAVTNLIDNAIRYTPNGGSITVTTEYDDKNAKLNVADTGIGIADEQVTGLFKKFARLEKSKTINPEGLGLGLYITQQIVSRHDGELKHSQNSPEGTVFTVILPL